MAFVDEASIFVEGGKGGNGCISFRREKYVPLGGPNGGNGGRGGNVFISATRDKTTLLDFNFHSKFSGGRGGHGLGKDMDGRGGGDLVLSVPVGTMVFEKDTGELVGDLKCHGDSHLIASGGKGGRGNKSFASSTLRAPRVSTKGECGESKLLRLELRLMADVGLIGFPNVGKSSFLRAVSNARPKVGDYAFTTLEPYVGVSNHKGESFVIADLPGLIEGASSGLGLGFKFLRHMSRNRLFLHLVESTETVKEIKRKISIIRKELKSYDPGLIEREEILVMTKTDLLSPRELREKKQKFKSKEKVFWVSSINRNGIVSLMDKLSQAIQKCRLDDVPSEESNSEICL